MRRDALAIAASVLLGACSNAPGVLEIPDALRARHAFFAAVGFDDNGDPIALSGIDGVDGHVELEVADIGALVAVDVLAWEAADLPGMSSADRADARTTPLTIAQRCDGALAPPRAAERVFGDGPASLVALSLTSAVVPSAACLPGWTRDLTVEPRCVALPCPAVITEHGCQADVKFADCELDTYRVSARLGPPCVARIGDVCGVAELPSGGTELSCTGRIDCDLRFYTARSSDWASVTRTPVLQVSPQQPGDLGTFGMRSLHRFSGYLGPIIALGDRVAVVTHRGRFYERSFCQSTEPSDLRWYDLDANLVATATIPACIRPLQALPDGRRAIGAWMEESTVWVGELIREGGVVRRHAVDLGPVTRAQVLSESVVLADRTVVVGLSTDPTAPGNTTGKLLAINPETLAVRVIDTPDSNVMSLAIDRREVVFGGDNQDVVVWMDPVSGALVTSALVPTTGSKSVGDLEVDVATDRVLLAVPGSEPVIHTYFRRQIAERALVFDDAWLPTTMVRAGPDPGQILVASTLLDRKDNSYRAGLSRINLEEDGVQPGIVHLGYGLVGEHARDTRGVLWATLPWSAEIVRVRLEE